VENTDSKELFSSGKFSDTVEKTSVSGRFLWQVRNFHDELMAAGLEKTQSLAIAIARNVADSYEKSRIKI
jgi:hypothetical protein